MSISFDLCLEATQNGHARLSGAALQLPQEFDPVACWNGSIDHVSDGILGGLQISGESPCTGRDTLSLAPVTLISVIPDSIGQFALHKSLLSIISDSRDYLKITTVCSPRFPVVESSIICNFLLI